MSTTETEAPLLVSVIEAARSLGISRSKAYDLMNDGTLPYVQLGDRRLIVRQAVIDLVSAVYPISAQ
jgi:excisionase family DNA binding protein